MLPMDNDWIQIFDNEYENISANIRVESETDRISENENVPIQVIMCQEKKNVKIFLGFLMECSAEIEVRSKRPEGNNAYKK